MMPVLNLLGGSLPFRYYDSWSDTTIKMPIAANVKARDVVFKLTPLALQLGIRGANPAITASYGIC